MSIAPDFADDLFISYAHVNDQRIADDDDGWVTDLHDILSKKLLEEMRVKPKISSKSCFSSSRAPAAAPMRRPSSRASSAPAHPTPVSTRS
jgi:hypothetical protein